MTTVRVWTSYSFPWGFKHMVQRYVSLFLFVVLINDWSTSRSEIWLIGQLNTVWLIIRKWFDDGRYWKTGWCVMADDSDTFIIPGAVSRNSPPPPPRVQSTPFYAIAYPDENLYRFGVAVTKLLIAQMTSVGSDLSKNYTHSWVTAKFSRICCRFYRLLWSPHTSV